uniref:OTU domain-containing protein n=1 Tax=Tetraselmis chuii TaxID=63592 RepID=A0A7S1SPJ6_9CHLO|mmetsp:Transcript_22212/g.39619  ORF Transcript_22212/g.39619 Transcript_22212/m.39619 type:complete len:268 (+) Transcript_22212:317-1120(+)
MECFPAQPASRLGDDGLEHMVSTKSTPLLRMSSSLQRRPLMAVNAEITDASRELVRSISNLQSPTFVKRDTSSVATVNVGAALEDGMQPVGRAFQRLSSQRMDSFRMLPTIPHNQEAQHGVVLPERTSSIVTSTVSKPHLTRLSSWTVSRKFLDFVIKREQESQRDEQELAQHVRLRGRLSRLHLVEHEQAGDGNCQFRSISHQLYDTPKWHQFIRKKAVAHMKRDSSFFLGFLGEELDVYCEEMLMNGTWGDELTLVREENEWEGG